jgi:hypothetical protein
MLNVGGAISQRSIIMATQQSMHNPTEQREQRKDEAKRKPEEHYPDEGGKRTDPHDKQGARHGGKDEGEKAAG